MSGIECKISQKMDGVNLQGGVMKGNMNNWGPYPPIMRTGTPAGQTTAQDVPARSLSPESAYNICSILVDL